jgi:hypothetical protein
MQDYLATHGRLARVFEKQIVFVVGATRWGTAWVQQFLDAHPEICCKGEGHFTDSLFPKLARAFDEYNAGAEAVGNRLVKSGLPGNAAGFMVEDVDYLMAAAVGVMFDRWLRGAGEGVRVIGEKTPEHVVSLALLARVLPGLKVVHVYRDGRDEAVSAWDFNNALSKGAFRRQFPAFADFARAFAQNWSHAVDAVRRFDRGHRGRCIHLRAEALTDDQAPALRPLLEFLGVDAADATVARAAERAWEAAPLDVDAGIWKKTLDRETAALFNRDCGELLKLLGYAAEDKAG